MAFTEQAIRIDSCNFS